MTEKEWLQGTNPFPLIDFAGVRLTERKGALFGCACCRLVWHVLAEHESRQAIEQAERYWNGDISRSARQLAARRARGAARRARTALNDAHATDGANRNRGIAALAGSIAADVAAIVALHGYYRGLVKKCLDAFGMSAIAAQQTPHKVNVPVCNAFRDIVGSPFKPSPQDGAWFKTPVVLGVAADILSQGHFDRLPVLADALEEAGCTDVAILDHCRQPGDHWRGCWVVDFILGKS